MRMFNRNNRSWIVLSVCAALLGACDSNDSTTQSNNSGAAGTGTAGMEAADAAMAAAAADSGRPGAGAKDIVDTAVGVGQFTTLAKALTDTGLVATLKGAGPFTVFAPTDAAFAALPAGTLASLTNDQLKAILLYHVVGAKALAADLDGKPLSSVGGPSLFVNLTGGVTINDAKVTTADVAASNGVIHVIDKVLLPPNIVDAAKYAGKLTTLVKAVTDAGLADTLSGPGPFTVFAPTDDAFAALPAGTLAGLSPADLKNVLLYHAVSGSVKSTDLSAGKVDTLLTGKQVTVDLSSGVKINDAAVAIADVVVTNGIIHVIDKVLLP
jgi:transforming growth factor-beta-induced protein